MEARNYLKDARKKALQSKNHHSDLIPKLYKWDLSNGDDYRTSEGMEVRRVGVIGGGTMGRCIAFAFARIHCSVTLVEVDHKAIERVQAALKGEMEALVRKGNSSAKEAETVLAAIGMTSNVEDLSQTDLVVEAIHENMMEKKRLLFKLDHICPKETIFATNTSTLNIDQFLLQNSFVLVLCGSQHLTDQSMMSAVLSEERKAAFVGMHFFTPAHVTPCIEVVSSRHTRAAAVATAFQLAQRMNKTAVLVRNGPGFVVNRMLLWYARQSQRLVSHHSFLPQHVDAAVQHFGLPLGPFKMADMNGIDIMLTVAEAFAKDSGLKDYVPDPLARKLLSLNRLGRKTGAGYYAYDAIGRRHIDPSIEPLIAETKASNFNQDSTTNTYIEVCKFLFLPAVNEGFKLLQDGIAASPSDIDLLWVTGCGWPEFRGGPMYWAIQDVGLKHVLAFLEHQFTITKDEMWRPAETIRRWANENGNLGVTQLYANL